LPFCSVTLKAQKPTKLPRILSTLGDHLKKRRLELGLYQAQVAGLIGVDESTVTNWEKNRTNPILWVMPKIIEFLGYHPSTGDYRTLGGRLLQYRESRGMSQKGLAKRIGIDPTTLSRLERNEGTHQRRISQKTISYLEIHGSLRRK
jgi:transcriptional regulator with XRE-family HTH domain